MSRSIKNRRAFLSTLGKTAIAVGVAQPVLAAAEIPGQAELASPPVSPSPAPGAVGADLSVVTNPMSIPNPSAADFVPVTLPRLEAATEKKKPALAAPLNRSQQIGFAVVGLGHLSLEEILPAFGAAKYARLVALVSGDKEKASKVARQYNVDPASVYDYAHFDDIAANPAIQVVYIVLPNGMHEEYTLRAAKAGKHVLCEKPMSVSSASAKKMIEACDRAGRHLMIAYRIQYEPKNALTRQWVRNKTYGNVKAIEASNTQNTGDPAQWRLKKSLAGGGSLPDIGLYCLNTARYLLGEEPEWVLAASASTTGDVRFTEVEESMMFQLGFPGGAQVNCMTHYGVHESRRYRCFTDKGAWYGLDPAFSYHGLAMQLSRAEENLEWNSKPDPGDLNQFALELDHMSLCVIFDKKPYTPGEEGLQDHRIMEAIYASAATGKKVMLEKITSIDTFRGTSPDMLLPKKS